MPASADQFGGLTASVVGQESLVLPAQRFLASAYDSVSSLFEQAFPALRATRTGERGRLTHGEHDLFRAAVVFTGAGVDAVLKQALRSCAESRIEQSPKARELFEDFAVKHLQQGDEISAKRLAQLLTGTAPTSLYGTCTSNR